MRFQTPPKQVWGCHPEVCDFFNSLGKLRPYRKNASCASHLIHSEKSRQIKIEFLGKAAFGDAALRQ
jgi:hypothetical protein